ncbi:catalase family protein [Planctomyces sp. SH-PL62]|uniref:catalase family protein n=1 Tax=Planctomyces sp. SH-PL62 TaxID=1636152 RepID=UPI00078D98D9|nr:catalase family protein [Planctomyces sp. SH-PL62]AMV37449.1 Catalase [Planctomyces sp. SH-PL62]
MYHSGENAPPGENAAIEKVVELSLKLVDKAKDPVPRGQHPKTNGVVRADFVVDPSGLPPECRVGLFREARTFPALVRFSNGAQADDRKADVHGMAIKLLDVDGEKLIPEEKDARTHDFILVDHPIFFIPDAATYVPFSEALAKAKGVEPSAVRSLLFLLPKGPRAGMTLAASLIASLGVKRGTALLKLVKEALGKTPDSPLTTRYWSTTPYCLGPKAVKYTAIPDATQAPPRADSPDLLRLAMKSTLDHGGAAFTFAVQIQADPTSTPIEDPTVEWKESASPPISVARIVIPRQDFNVEARQTFGEHLSFTPWHALAEHAPIGGVNRARLPTYRAVSAERHRINRKPQVEPTLAEVERV